MSNTRILEAVQSILGIERIQSFDEYLESQKISQEAQKEAKKAVKKATKKPVEVAQVVAPTVDGLTAMMEQETKK